MAATLALAFAPVLHAAADQAAAAAPGKDAAKSEAKEKEPFGSLTVEEVSAKIKDPAVHVYDGNNLDVYVENHLPGAVRLYAKELKEGILPADKKTTLIFYCHNEL